MKNLLRYFKGNKVQTVLAPLFKLFEAVLELLVPLVVAEIVDKGIASADGKFILTRSLILIAIGLVGLVFSVTSQYFSAKSATGFATSLKRDLFVRVNKFSFSDFDKIGASTIITRMTNDVNRLQDGVNLTLRLFLRSPFIVFGAVIMAFCVDIISATVFVAVLPVLVAIIFSILLTGLRLYKKSQNELDIVTTLTQENVTGVRVIRAFAKENDEIDKFTKQNQKLTQMQLFAGKVSALMNPLTYAVVNVAIIALLYLGGKRVYSGDLTQGQVIALYNYLSQILIELIKLANLIITISRAGASGKRVSELLAVVPAQSFAETDIEEKSNDIAVEFQKVSLNYDGGENALSDINFDIKQGETVGIIGGTGSGKTSLINLIPRFYDATEGVVLVNGVDVKRYPKRQLRDKIAVVMQKPFLFSDTIKNNIELGNDLAQEELNKAIELSQSTDIINSKKKGVDEEILRGGANLSGGQRQRLSIARALAKKSEIIILDDASSALDNLTDARLRKGIGDIGKTVIIVAQKVNSVMSADKIVVLDEGKIVGMGSHEALMSDCPIYREIYFSQNGTEVGNEA